MTEETKNAQIPEEEGTVAVPETEGMPPVSEEENGAASPEASAELAEAGPAPEQNAAPTASDKLNDAAEAIAKADAEAKARKAEEKRQRYEAEKELRQQAEAARIRKAEEEERARRAKEKKLAELSYAENYRQKLKAERELREANAQKIKAQLKKEEEEQKRREEAERLVNEAMQSQLAEAEKRNAESDELLRRIAERKKRREEEREAAAAEPKRELPKREPRAPLSGDPIVISEDGIELLAPAEQDDFDIPDIGPINATNRKNAANEDGNTSSAPVEEASATAAEEAPAIEEVPAPAEEPKADKTEKKERPQKPERRESAPDDFVITLDDIVVPEQKAEEEKPEPTEKPAKEEAKEEPAAQAAAPAPATPAAPVAQKPENDPLADYMSGLGTFDMLTKPIDFGIEYHEEAPAEEHTDTEAKIYTPDDESNDYKYDAGHVLLKEEFELPKKKKNNKPEAAPLVVTDKEESDAEPRDEEISEAKATAAIPIPVPVPLPIGRRNTREGSAVHSGTDAGADTAENASSKENSAAQDADDIAEPVQSVKRTAAVPKENEKKNKKDKSDDEAVTYASAIAAPIIAPALIASNTRDDSSDIEAINARSRENELKAEKERLEAQLSEMERNHSERIAALSEAERSAKLRSAEMEISAKETAYENEISRLNAQMQELEARQTEKENELQASIDGYESKISDTEAKMRAPEYYGEPSYSSYAGDDEYGESGKKGGSKSADAELAREAAEIHAAMALAGISKAQFKKQLKKSAKSEKNLIKKAKKLRKSSKKLKGEALAAAETEYLSIKRLLLESYSNDYRLCLSYGTKAEKSKYLKKVKKTTAEYNKDIDRWCKLTGGSASKCSKNLYEDIERGGAIYIPAVVYRTVDQQPTAASGAAKLSKRDEAKMKREGARFAEEDKKRDKALSVRGSYTPGGEDGLSASKEDYSKETDEIHAAMALVGISKAQFKKQLKKSSKNEKKLISKAKKLRKSSKKLKGEALAVAETEYLGIKRLLLESYSNDYRLCLSYGTKAEKSKYLKKVKKTTAEYNKDIDRWCKLTGGSASKCSKSLYADIESRSPIFIPAVVYRPALAAGAATAPVSKRDEAKMKREGAKFAEQDKKRDKLLDRRSIPADKRVSELKVDNASYKKQEAKDIDTVESRINYRIAKLEYALTTYKYRFAEAKHKDKASRKAAMRRIKELKKATSVLLKELKRDRRRYLTVIKDDPYTVKASRRADRERMAQLRYRIISLLCQKDEINARLLNLYKDNDVNTTKSSGKNVHKRITAVKLKATRRSHSSQKGHYKRVNRMRVTRARKEEIYVLMDKKTRLSAHLAECKYRLKHEKPKGAPRRALLNEIKKTQRSIKLTEREIHVFSKRAAKRSRKTPSKLSMAIYLIILLLIIAAVVAVVLYWGPISAYVSGLLASFGLGA